VVAGVVVDVPGLGFGTAIAVAVFVLLVVVQSAMHWKRHFDLVTVGRCCSG
jgi:hypothetical protein